MDASTREDIESSLDVTSERSLPKLAALPAPTEIESAAASATTTIDARHREVIREA